ncbi:hypothetical protein GPX89_34360 [Nocardia sp. ET3-3]|uniref:SUKH-3 immunity protein of toxin-antitoxin system n=1 Tax=Nocardia terrae TaxID=2675851 RepID=A0A7K1V6Z7_9NOCA|nr:SUKH-3 domain-containing protein [Nocardia terrae]MVU82307.1 hypothetical protein [Nocardia terrae]
MKIDWPNPVTSEVVPAAGWTPDRRIDVTDWFADLDDQGYLMSPAAVEILESFGKLALRPPEAPEALWGADPIFFDPLEVGDGNYDRYADLEAKVGHRMSPLAAKSSGTSSLLILDDGRVVSDDVLGLRLLGTTFPEAVDLVLRRYRRPEFLLRYAR